MAIYHLPQPPTTTKTRRADFARGMARNVLKRGYVAPEDRGFRDRAPGPSADMPKAVENWRIIGKITASIVARCVAEDDRNEAA